MIVRLVAFRMAKQLEVNGFRAVLERMGQEYITDAAAVNEWPS